MESLELRLLAQVILKLKCKNIKFHTWRENKDGSDTPVFIIPKRLNEKASELSLTFIN